MGVALYRKHRSRSLGEVVGQEPVTAALQAALDSGRLSHAYLFTGPRGTGKTSVARIMAHAINGLPYSEEPNLDIIEIDAASNRRIDEIRELRDKVYIAPASAKYKVYIIDEVHMLTREAFNALLKTLEEPPAHAVFILATTDAHKLPDTIISRTQRFSFRAAEPAVLQKHLAAIAKKEGFKIDDPALVLLAEHARGSYRDGVSLLDQVASGGLAVDAAAVHELLGVPPAAALDELTASLSGLDISGPVKVLESLYDSGYRAPAIAEQLGRRLRQQVVGGTADNPAAILNLLAELLGVAGALQPERQLELALMSAVMSIATPPASAAKPTPQPTVTPISAPETKPVAPEPAIKPEELAKSKGKPAPKSAKVPEPTKEAAKIPKAAAKPEATAAKAQTAEYWPAVLEALKKRYNTIYGVVRMAQVDASAPGQLELRFGFAFHQKRINDPKNRQIILEIIEQVSGQRPELKAVLDKAAKPSPVRFDKPAIAAAKATSGDLAAVSAVFGGGEMI